MPESGAAGPPGSASPGDRLESWKEIAAYLGRTPRTVQRWERQEGLPVHRLVHDKLGSVYANRSELDAWWAERKARLEAPEGAGAAEHDDEAPPPAKARRTAYRGAIVLGAVAVASALGWGAWRLAKHASGPASVRIAVLPFENMGGGPDQEYLSDGLTEEMITELGRLHPQRLGVIARTSVMRYKGASPGVDRIGSELGVDYVLEGSVRQSSSRVRVAVKLVRVKDQTPLWAESYERPRDDVLELEGDVARSVAGEIRGRIGDARWAGRRGDLLVDPQAYEAYLKGRYLWNQRTDDGLKKSAALFEEAVSRDPGYAAAWSGLADAYTLMANYSVLPATEAFPKAKSAALRALELDPDLAEAHASMAFILRNYDWDFAGADREFERAIALNPNGATAQFWYAIHLESLGRFGEAHTVVERALRLDPLSPGLNGFRSTLLLTSGRYDESIALDEKALKLEPDNFSALLNLGRALVQKGQRDRAIAVLQKAVDSSHGHPMAVAVLGYAYGRAGRTPQAEECVARLQTLSRERHVAAYYFAVAEAGLGHNAQALDWLEKVYEERHVGVLSLKTDPELAGLRGDPRFRVLLRKVGLPG